MKRWNWRIAEKRDAGMQTRPRKRSPKRILARLHLPSPSWTVPASRIVAWDVGLSGLWPVACAWKTLHSHRGSVGVRCWGRNPGEVTHRIGQAGSAKLGRPGSGEQGLTAAGQACMSFSPEIGAKPRTEHLLAHLVTLLVDPTRLSRRLVLVLLSRCQRLLDLMCTFVPSKPACAASCCGRVGSG